MRLLTFCFLLLIGQASRLVGQPLSSVAYQHYGEGKLDSAAAAFEQRIRADSTRPDERAMLSDIYRQQNRHDEAVREATAALRLTPRSVCYWTILGNAHWAQGLTDLAMQDYLKSLDVAATAPVQPSHTISVLRAVRPYQQIEKQVTDLLAASGATAAQYVLLGYALHQQSQFAESLSAYQKALSMQPDWVEPYLFISELHRSAKQPEAMVEAYEQAVAHDPFISGKLYKAALQDYTKALREGTGSFAYFALGQMHEKGLGVPVSLTEARRWYAYAEQLHNPVAAVRLMQLYASGAVPVATASEEIRRIQRNREAGRRSHAVEIKLPNGNYQTVPVFVETYPADKTKPYAAEQRRLHDVWGVTVDLASLLPPERAVEPVMAESPPKPQPLETDATLTASLMASPLLTTAVSTSAVQPARAALGKPGIAQLFNQRVTRYGEPAQADSLAALMAQTLTDYLGEVAQTPIVAMQRLREDIVADRADKGFLYYAIAFLHEQMAGSADWSAAEKWYLYAFQLHYMPAYQRLKRRYGQEVLSPVKLARLEKNWANGVTEIPLTLETAEGAIKTVSLYVLDNMGNSPEPIAPEVARLMELYEVEVPPQTITRFNDLYREARQSNLSYQDLCRQAFLSKS